MARAAGVAVVVVAAACGGGEPGPTPPMIEVAEPALAIIHDDPDDNPGGRVLAAIDGSLGPPIAGTFDIDDCGTDAGGSFVVAQLYIAHPGDGGAADISLTSYEAVGSTTEHADWRPERMVVSMVSEARDANQVVVCTPVGVRIVSLEKWAYTHYDLPPSPGTTAAPLSIASWGDGVWTNEEFHLQLKGVQVPSTIVVEDLPQAAGPGIFAQTIFGDTPTHIATLGESIITDGSLIWLTESGVSPYNGTNPNHARLIRYYPPTRQMRVFNVPGDDNGVIGLAWDFRRQRMWFTQGRRAVLDGFDHVIALPARLTSFDPDRFAWDSTFPFTPVETCVIPGGELVGACSTTTTRKCLTDHDCVLADQVCPPGVTDDSACFHEYPLPDDIELPAHVMTDQDGSIWYAAYWGGNHIGRLDPDRGVVTTFPLSEPDGMAACDYDSCSCFFEPPPEPCPAHCCQYQLLHWGPWSLIPSPRDGGGVLFCGQTSLQLAELEAGAAGDLRCQTLENGENPCVTEWTVPGLDPLASIVHSIAAYDSGRVLVTTSPGLHASRDPQHPASVGFLDTNTGRFRMFPPLSRYPFSDANGFVAFGGGGITVGPGDPPFGGEAFWFTDYFRHRLGRFLKQY